jgi:3-oxoadipate enol-lactonase
VKILRSGDAQIAYEVIGKGAPVVLLHPFPVTHEFWLPAGETLVDEFRLILPDLRGHGDSQVGDGPATMEKHAQDIARILDQEKIGKVPIAGVSIGGYVIFEFWRRLRGRVSALALFNTKAQADLGEARSARLQAADDVLKKGTEQFFAGMVQKVLGSTTRSARPDLIEGALRMMRKSSAESIAAIQRGMAERPDSLDTLKSINVPTMIVTGEEDSMTGVGEAELMRRNISGSRMKVIPRAGHYSPWEQPERAAELLREFLTSVR